ncbi:methylenetetrahydrofolate reductase (NADPH)-like [Oppia nitens]|uniref:methylenetetrahydrofolate reductase (NADPH)-like n=1 Tax=Oppia nitens TaxID=1686743 RepID=UPI0023DC412D|nr:methylenetetrahydrofolate reductase (NADPH)-like [Oppia nitens]
MRRRMTSGETPFFSFEFFPPKTREAAINLVARLERMRQSGPLFCDITWHTAGNPESDTETSSITIAGVALNYCSVDTMLHITCVGMTEKDLKCHLERIKNLGIRNILALRGDRFNYDGDTEDQPFKYAIDLVRFIRREYGNYFTIAVAGYPSAHPESESMEMDLQRLKDKVDAGADFIITQLFFKSEVFVKYVKNCRKIGITVPILAGIMPIQSYESLGKIVKLSQLDIPEALLKDLEIIRNNDEAIRNYGIQWTVDLCRQILAANVTNGLHFYTLNQEVASSAILKQLGLWTQVSRPLPWCPAANHKRSGEDVRPIYWSGRQKSYVCRTQSWNDFPNGRWGSIDSPAFQTLENYYLFLEARRPRKQLLQMWGQELNKEQDVWDVFYHYITETPNKMGHKVSVLPWNMNDLSCETGLLVKQLSKFNKKGILTTCSQPNVNCVESTHPIHGWGAKDGYVYQKAYIEFFTPETNVLALIEALKNYPHVNYQITNSCGSHSVTNIENNKAIAVTWGVFPGREIIQPTVVDPISFKVWKDEAFGLWKQKWAQIYPPDSPSRQLLDHIHDNYYLVNLVDNHFPKECCLWSLLDDMFAIREKKILPIFLGIYTGTYGNIMKFTWYIREFKKILKNFLLTP